MRLLCFIVGKTDFCGLQDFFCGRHAVFLVDIDGKGSIRLWLRLRLSVTSVTPEPLGWVTLPLLLIAQELLDVQEIAPPLRRAR